MGGAIPLRYSSRLQDDLPLGDISGQVGDGMGLVVLRHGENGNQRDGAVGPLLPSRPFIQGGQIGIHITGIAPPAGNLFAGGGYLPQGVGIVGDVGHDNQYLHPQVKGQVFGGGQRHLRGGYPLDGWVVGQIDKEHRPIQSAGFPEGLDEIMGFLKGDTHGGEHHRKGRLFPFPRRRAPMACRAIWAARLAWGRPEAENIGSFCPRTRVFRPSMADTPVWMNSCG